ncbi:hypothetical protein RRG08_066455 [Elysia crispata]|uniref:Uncharacterized protein n=1 Tax=Elysia crispata TaxID=231223 RepID=A0AAE1DE25_9GAST|nr:hypothetical protein RRG08_066455 [Elysia crispata]
MPEYGDPISGGGHTSGQASVFLHLSDMEEFDRHSMGQIYPVTCLKVKDSYSQWDKAYKMHNDTMVLMSLNRHYGFDEPQSQVPMN